MPRCAKKKLELLYWIPAGKRVEYWEGPCLVLGDPTADTLPKSILINRHYIKGFYNHVWREDQEGYELLYLDHEGDFDKRLSSKWMRANWLGVGPLSREALAYGAESMEFESGYHLESILRSLLTAHIER